MPICIECRYPVPQLYHVLHSTKQHKSVPTTPHRHSSPYSNPAANADVDADADAVADTVLLAATHPPPPPPAVIVTVAAATTAPSSFSTLAARNGGGEKIAVKAKSSPKAGGGGGGGGGKGGGDVRLTQCPRCKRFADKYVEHDFVVLFIDLVLVKPQVYRHLLFNRLGRDDDELDPSITRLGILLLLFDVYLTWSHIESLPPHLTARSPIPAWPIPLQYVFYLLLSLLSVLAQHATIRFLVRKIISSPSSSSSSPSSSSSSSSPSSSSTTAPVPAPPTPQKTPAFPTPSAISTALFVSSGMKLFPLLMVVWGYDDNPRSNSAHNHSSSNPSGGGGGGGGEGGGGARRSSEWGSVGTGVEWAVAVQNLEALRILLGCGYWAAGALVAAGWVAGHGVRALVLGIVGLGEAGRG